MHQVDAMLPDRDATPDLEALVRDHAPFVRRLARALVGDGPAADDLAQDTWLAAARASEIRSPRAWFKGTVRRLAARHFGRRRVAALDTEPIGPSTDPDDVLAALEAEQGLLRALEALDEPFRTALYLRYRQELPLVAIAERVGAPVNTVRSRLRIGLARLRERLDRDTGGHGRASLFLLIHPLERAPAIAAVAAPASLIAMKKLVPLIALLLIAAAWMATRTPTGPRHEGSEVTSRDGLVPFDSSGEDPIEVERRDMAVESSVAGEVDTPTSDALAANEFSLRGIVVDPGESPVEGADVEILDLHGRVQVADRTGPDGRFGVRELSRPALLRVRAEGHAPHVSPRLTFRELALGDPLTVVLQTEGARLEIVVRSDEGPALAGAEVEFFRGQGERIERARKMASAETDAAGRLDVGPLAPGPYTVVARAEGFAARDMEVELEREVAPRRLELVLGRGFDVVGEALAPDRNVPPGLYLADDTELRGVEVEPSGAFRLTGLTPDRVHRLVVRREGVALARFDARGAPGEILRWDPELAPAGGVIAGTVQLPEGEDPSHWRVAAYGEPDSAGGDRNGQWLSSAVDAAGQFRIACDPRLSHRVILRDVRIVPIVDEIEDVVPDRTDLVLDATKRDVWAGRIAGRFSGVDEEDNVVAVACQLLSEGQISAPEPVAGGWSRTDDDWRFAIDGLQPGEYAVWRVGPGPQEVELARVVLDEVDARVDLGEHMVEQAGSLQLRWEWDDGRVGAGEPLQWHAFMGKGSLGVSGKIEAERGSEGAVVTDLAPGRYEVRLNNRFHSSQSQTCEIAPGATTVLTFELVERTFPLPPPPR